MKKISLSLIAASYAVQSSHALHSRRSDMLAFARQPSQQTRQDVSSTTSRSLFPPFTTTTEFRKKYQQTQEMEEEDILYAQVKPKLLVHERDFFRQAVRVQAWDEYVIVSILCTSISFNALQSFTLHPEHEGIFLYEEVLKTVVQLTAAASVLSGIYTTMIFSISILYCRTALGMEQDIQYDGFLEKTGGLRIRAFRAFNWSLGFFAILVVLILSEELPTVMHLPVGSLMLFALYIGFRDWQLLVDSATPIYMEDE